MGSDLLADFESIVAARVAAHKYAVISDSNVAAIYGQSVTRQLDQHCECELFEFPAGEQHKTREVWVSLTDRMLDAGFGRDCAVIALGGGVVGDLAGFVAATYLRGVPFVQVPTSLLAMIDSSIGGKTGVDTQHGKNLVGSFYQPAVVVADVSTLATLPSRHLSGGVAEAIKHGAISSTEYFDWIVAEHDRILRLEPGSLIQLVERSVEIKAAVVSEDEREAGRRAMLNFGHTIGHALESESCFALIHGEAIAVGMVAEADLGTRAGVTTAGTADALRDAARAFRLPVSGPPGIDVGKVLETTATDKKNRSGSVRFALLERIGQVARNLDGGWTHAVSQSAIREAIELIL